MTKEDLKKLVVQIQSNIKAHNLITSTDNIIIATSAGVDSQLLLEIMVRLHPVKRISVVHVNHDLRPQAATEAKFVAQQAKKYGVKYFETTWIKAQHPEAGIEAAGRDYRYQFLEKIAHQVDATKILTAHHANDVAETFLMKLIRGGRWQQLNGIAWERNLVANIKVVRPMLNVRKSYIYQVAKSIGIDWYEDESNQDLSFTRNRIRHTTLPSMLSENTSAIEHINDYAEQFNDLAKLVDMQAQVYLTQAQKNEDWTQIPEPWLPEVIKSYVAKKMPTISLKTSQLKQIIQLLKNDNRANGQITLIDGWYCVKEYKNLFLVKYSSTNKNAPTVTKDCMLTLNKWHLLPNGGKFIVKPKVNQFKDLTIGTVIPLAINESQFPLRMRTRLVGDVLKLKFGHQKVKRVMIDAKIPTRERDYVPLIVNAQGEVLWIVGYKHAWVEPKTVNYEILYIPGNTQENLLNDDEQRH